MPNVPDEKKSSLTLDVAHPANVSSRHLLAKGHLPLAHEAKYFPPGQRAQCYHASYVSTVKALSLGPFPQKEKKKKTITWSFSLKNKEKKYFDALPLAASKQLNPVRVRYIFFLLTVINHGARKAKRKDRSRTSAHISEIAYVRSRGLARLCTPGAGRVL